MPYSDNPAKPFSGGVARYKPVTHSVFCTGRAFLLSWRILWTGSSSSSLTRTLQTPILLVASLPVLWVLWHINLQTWLLSLKQKKLKQPRCNLVVWSLTENSTEGSQQFLFRIQVSAGQENCYKKISSTLKAMALSFTQAHKNYFKTGRKGKVRTRCAGI